MLVRILDVFPPLKEALKTQLAPGGLLPGGLGSLPGPLGPGLLHPLLRWTPRGVLRAPPGCAHALPSTWTPPPPQLPPQGAISATEEFSECKVL